MTPHGLKHFFEPCNINSCYHDLKCGHRVRTSYPDACSLNCKAPKMHMSDTLFICESCVIEDVRLALEIAVLGFKSGDDVYMDANTMTRPNMALIVAEKQVTALKTKHHRVCVFVEKLNPFLQYYAEIPEAQCDGGFLCAQTAVHERKRPLTKACVYSKSKDEDVRAPHRHSHSPGARRVNRSRSPETRKGQRGGYREREPHRDTVDTSLDGLVDHLGGTRVGSEVEDGVRGDEDGGRKVGAL